MKHEREDAVVPHEVDYLVIGAGPAGMQVGYFLGQAGLDYRILEAGSGPGTFFRRFPRHRTLISVNKVQTGYDDPETNLRWDWNSLLSDDHSLLFRDYSSTYFPAADDLVRYLEDYAERFGLAIEYDSRVETVSKTDDHFELLDQQGRRWRARHVICAAGFTKPYLPEIPGIDTTENYMDMPIDADGFAGQKVLILGKGNSAFETADHLVETTALIHVASPNPIKMAWKTHFVGHLRAVNNNFLDTYQLKSQNAVLDCDVHSIEKDGDEYRVSVRYSHAGEETEVLVYDRVLACTGFEFDGSIFAEECRPSLVIDDRLPAQTSSWESVNVPGLFFSGVLTQVRDFKKTTSAFIHGFRYNARSLVRMLAQRHHGQAWPSHEVEEISPAGLLDAFQQRIDTSSGLWQQFGFLGDLIVVDGDRARYYEELPVDYIHESEFGKQDDYYVLTLEFGKICGDPFNIERKPVPEAAAESTFLHPVVRHFRRGELLGEHHVLENLYGEWKQEDLHREPLRAFLAEQMGWAAHEVATPATA